MSVDEMLDRLSMEAIADRTALRIALEFIIEQEGAGKDFDRFLTDRTSDPSDDDAEQMARAAGCISDDDGIRMPDGTLLDWDDYHDDGEGWQAARIIIEKQNASA